MYSSSFGTDTPAKAPCPAAGDPAPADLTDIRLVEQFNAGNDSAFAEIMRRYRSRIFTLTLGQLRNHADAEEITQDTFIRAHRSLGRFRGDCSLSSWLYRIAVNLARNRYWYFFRRRRQDSISLDHALGGDNGGTFSDLVADPARDPAQEAATGEFSRLINACMAQLDVRHREILTLRSVLNHSYREIATILGINVGTVKSRIARARENLRALLTEAAPDFAPDSPSADWFLPSHASYGRPVMAAC